MKFDEIINKLTHLYYWFQIGAQFMPLVSFILLCITASTNIQAFLGKYIEVPAVPMIAIMVFTGVSGVFFIGFFLDVILKYPHRQTRLGNERNLMLMEIYAMLKKLSEEKK